MGEGSSIDAVAAAAREESVDFAGISLPDGAVTLLLAEAGDATAQRGAALGKACRAARRTGCEGGGRRRHVLVRERPFGLRCAVELQQALRSARLRIGIHSGFVMADESDFYGRNVVLVARIADHAEPGEILASAMIREYTATDPSFEFEPRGEQHFKGLLGEHPVFAVSWS